MAAAAKKGSYDAHDIEWHKGLEGVRKRPAMYLGSEDSAAILHMAKEIVDNSNDEATNGHADHIIIVVDTRSGTVYVKDNGRGVPVGPHPRDKKRDAMEIIFTELHAGGKFSAANYDTSKGVHGVGSSVVNACSAEMHVYSYRNKQWNYMSFSEGEPDFAKPKVKPLPKIEGIKDDKRGTLVQFTPDLTVFNKGSKLSIPNLHEWLDEVSWLIPAKFELYVIVDGKGVGKGKDAHKTYHHPNGLGERFELLCEKAKVEPLADPFVVSGKNFDVMIGWTNGDVKQILSSVSAGRTVDGGTHERGLIKAIAESFYYVNPKLEVDADSLMTGMIAVVNVKLSEPKFNSQDKVKLISPEGETFIYNALYDEDALFYEWLKKQKELMAQVISRAEEIFRLNSEFKASKKLAAELATEKKGKITFPDKFRASTTKNAAERELFVVEGDSAAGTAGQARDARFQEIFCLTGKPANIWKGDPEKALANQRIIDMLKVIGYSPKTPKQYRVGKILLLADADTDGSHIAALIMGLMQKVCPDLYEQGMVYRVDAPLYTYALKDGKLFADDQANLKKMVEAKGLKFDGERVTRLKGWGEVDAKDLKVIAFNEHRKLIRMKPIKDKKALQKLIDMLGESAEARRELLGLDG